MRRLEMLDRRVNSDPILFKNLKTSGPAYTTSMDYSGVSTIKHNQGQNRIKLGYMSFKIE